MRQSFIVLFIFCTFLFVIGYFPVDFSNKLQPELFIDSEALLVSKNYNFVERINNFKTTPLANTFNDMDLSLVSAALDIPEIDHGAIIAWKKKVATFIDHPLMNEIFGSEFTLALIPDTSLVQYSVEKDLATKLLVIARPRHHARILELFSDLIDPEGSVTEARYGGYVIKRIPVESDQSVAVVRVKDLLLISLNERILRKSLDVYDQKSSLISEVTDYSRITSSFEKSSSITYVNVSKMIDAMTSYLNQADGSSITTALPQKLNNLKGYKYLIWGTWDNKDSLSHKATVSFNSDEMLPEYRELFRVEPSKSDVHKRINTDTIWYYWTNILRPRALLALYNQQMSTSEKSASHQLIDDIKEITGHTTEELFSLIENDFLIALKNSPEEQFIPIPRLLFAIKTSNPEELYRVIENVTDFYEIPLSKQSINGADIYLWGGVIPTGDLQPTFCVTDNYLVISSNRQQIKEFLLSEDGYPSLDSNPRFLEVTRGISDQNNSINYIDSRSLAALVKEIFSWIGTMIAIQDRAAAEQSKILIDHFINPLLDGLSMYSTIGMRSYTGENKIIIESIVIKDYGKK